VNSSLIKDQFRAQGFPFVLVTSSLSSSFGFGA